MGTVSYSMTFLCIKYKASNTPWIKHGRLFMICMQMGAKGDAFLLHSCIKQGQFFLIYNYHKSKTVPILYFNLFLQKRCIHRTSLEIIIKVCNIVQKRSVPFCTVLHIANRMGTILFLYMELWIQLYLLSMVLYHNVDNKWLYRQVTCKNCED